MKRIQKKLQNQQGETLVELLGAILVATLSVALLLAGVAVSTQIGRQADQLDKSFYETLTAAEERQTPLTDGVDASPSIKIIEGAQEASLSVQVYGGEGLYSYKLNSSGSDGP